MTKKQLVAKIAADANISKTAADKAVASMIDTIAKTLKKGDKVTFVGFGTFSVKKRAARTGRTSTRRMESGLQKAPVRNA